MVKVHVCKTDHIAHVTRVGVVWHVNLIVPTINVSVGAARLVEAVHIRIIMQDPGMRAIRSTHKHLDFLIS